jgi:hypothetical protein
MKMKTTLIAALVCAGASLGVAPAALAQNAAPCSSPEYAQFDFWVGTWDVTAPDGSAAGSNRIEKILNGCVLQENWSGAGGSIGKSFNMYYARDKTWRQTWVDGQGSRLDLAGGWADGKMTLKGETPGQGGKLVRHEVSWTPQPDGTVVQHWRASRDEGKTWTDAFLGIYKKRE